MNNNLEKQVLRELYKSYNWPNINTQRLYKLSISNQKYFQKLCDKFYNNIQFNVANDLFTVMDNVFRVFQDLEAPLYVYVDLENCSIKFGINHKTTLIELSSEELYDLITNKKQFTTRFYIEKILNKLVREK